jgi:hypothetical protein
MALPATIRVKLSSEAAEAISLTPVVVQEMGMRDLIEHVLGVAGKDEARLREILSRGTLVSGGSRFRWVGWEPEPGALREMLATFPDPDPARAFDPVNCVQAVLRGARQSVAIPREAVSSRGLLRRPSFWDHMMELAGATAPGYSGYSYRDRADRYIAVLTVEHAARLRTAAGRIRYSTLRGQVQSLEFTQMELLARR